VLQEGPAEIRVHDKILEAGFVQVPVLLLRHPKLRPGAKLMYAVILWYQWHLGYWPGRRACSIEFGISLRSITNYFSELEEAGLIRIQRGEYDAIEGIEVYPPRPVQDLHRRGESVEGRPVQNLQRVEGVTGANFAPCTNRDTREPLPPSGPIHPSQFKQTALLSLARALLEQGRSEEHVQSVLRAYGAEDAVIRRILEQLRLGGTPKE